MTESISKMPRYKAYKDSGVKWIGEIPEGWSIKSLKYIAYLKSGETLKPEQFTDEGYPVYGGNGFRGYTSQYTNEGFNCLIGRQGALCGNVNYAKDRFYASEHAIVVYPLGSENILWLGETIRVANFNRLSQSTAQPGIAVNVIKNELFPYPSTQEQNSIADFLDQKTTQIDQAISLKEKQITLLKEHQQILIQNAVTRGLNPNAALRDSGVEWIGKVPEHWGIKRAKYLFEEVDERSTDGAEELLSVSHMTGVTPRSEKKVSMFMAENYTGSKTCQKNDLVFNIMWAWMGALGVADRQGIVSSSYGIFRQIENDTFSPEYIEYLLKTTGYIEHYNRVSTGLHSSRLRFYSHMFFNMELGYPPKKEQDEIIAYIKTQTTKINKAITLYQQQINKLKEYKATLINSAVTGKIKVVSDQ